MIEPHRSDPDLLVLHTLRCIGFASVARLESTLVGLVPVDVEGRLLSLASQGLVTHTSGAFGGWGVTDEGRVADAEWIARELGVAGAQDGIEGAYRAFLPLNRRTLDICGDWQLRRHGSGTVLNDHSDDLYDRRVLARLREVDAHAQVVCDRLAARLHRFSTYGPRLATAVQRSSQGELDQVTDSLDSYHSVWFQLHEDLLVTLALARES